MGRLLAALAPILLAGCGGAGATIENGTASGAEVNRISATIGKGDGRDLRSAPIGGADTGNTLRATATERPRQ